MPGAGDVRMPCGRWRYCGRAHCAHAVYCADLAAHGAAGRARPQTKEGAPVSLDGGPQEKTVRKKPLALPADVVYLYDGSMTGLYACVHESVYSRQLPVAICLEAEAQPTLFETRLIAADPEKAEKVEASISAKMGREAHELVRRVFFTCLADKELAILRFLLLGYREGPKTPWLFAHPEVKPLLDADKHMMGEVHLLKGFVRFSDYDGVLAAAISPKNFVLPFLAPHFAARYSGERFLIFDKTHRAALVYEDGRPRILPLEGIQFPQADEAEKGYRALWKQFYRTISIEARENPRLRMTNMPKRYWENMLELQELL